VSRTYDNYRWEPAHKRKGDRWYYKRDWVLKYHTGEVMRREEQVIATVQYDSNQKSPYWGKWHLSFGAQSPSLHRLRLQEIPKFTTKNEAINWATAMIALEGLS